MDQKQIKRRFHIIVTESLTSTCADLLAWEILHEWIDTQAKDNKLMPEDVRNIWHIGMTEWKALKEEQEGKE